MSERISSLLIMKTLSNIYMLVCRFWLQNHREILNDSNICGNAQRENFYLITVWSALNNMILALGYTIDLHV